MEQAAAAIAAADGLLIAAGAGMGVDSGLPDFRGDAGFWRAYPLLEKEGISFHDLANPHWFESHPSRAWGFYGHRHQLYRRTEPHAGFRVLQRWADAKTHFVFTSNVDGHFQKAGFERVYECHGSIHFLQCVAGCSEEIWPAGDLELEIDEARLEARGALPCCPQCGAMARPNILMFDDYGWLHQRSEAQYDRLEDWRWQMRGKKVVTVELGAGTALPTVRRASAKMPGLTVRINPREAEGGDEVIGLELGALEALEQLDAMLAGQL